MSTRRVAPKRCALPQGHACGPAEPIRGIPIAWQRWRAGAVLEAAAGGGGAPGLKAAATGGGASGLGAAAACGESGVHGTAASGAAEPAGGLLSPADFRRAVEMLPLVSIDLLLHDGQGRYLTGLRSNPPAQGAWFVPGGRIRKNEPLALALDRIAREELGLHAMAAAWTPCGVHEHFYSTNFAGEINRSTHYIVLAYEAERALIRPACRTRSIAATAGCRPPPSSPTLTCIPTPGPTSRSTRHDQSPPLPRRHPLRRIGLAAVAAVARAAAQAVHPFDR